MSEHSNPQLAALVYHASLRVFDAIMHGNPPPGTKARLTDLGEELAFIARSFAPKPDKPEAGSQGEQIRLDIAEGATDDPLNPDRSTVIGDNIDGKRWHG